MIQKENKTTTPKTEFTLPAPLELAKLAAILAPDLEPEQALHKAMTFYVEALLFASELPSNVDDLIRRYGNSKRHFAIVIQPAKAAAVAQWKDTVELDTTKDDDDARRFLADRGLRLKKADYVLKHIRRWCQRDPGKVFGGEQRPMPDDLIARFKCVKDGRTIYDIPKFILQNVADYAKRRSSDTKRRGWKTRKEKPSG